MFLKLFICFIEKPFKESLQGVYVPWSEFHFLGPTLGPSLFIFFFRTLEVKLV